jgi:hypothetical protein
VCVNRLTPTQSGQRSRRVLLPSLHMVSDIREEQYADLAPAVNAKGNL